MEKEAIYETYKDFPKLSTLLRETNHDLSNTFKDSYLFEFLNLPDPHSESDLQRGLVRQMKNLILEFGKDFLYIGEEYKLQVGNSDFYIDLLFYHRGLQCLVAFELKADKFKPDHLGQLNFYLEALDRDVKKPNENPSIGVLLCKDKDSEVVEYALSRSYSSTMVSEYKTQLPDKKIYNKNYTNYLTMRRMRNRATTANTGFASGGVTCKLGALCFYSSSVLG